jgi:DNA-binding NarL/FixJ family response regulator
LELSSLLALIASNRVESEAPAKTEITVLVADDQQLVRAGLALIVNGEPDMRVVGEAQDGLEALDLTRKRTPDVVLLDIRMPAMDGLTASRRILAETSSRVILLTTFDADEYVFEGLRAGASGFLLKDTPPEQLCWAIRNVAAGNALIDPTVTRRMILRFAAAAGASDVTPERLSDLTARELDVLRLIARGRSNAEIAADLVIEESTVKSHVARVLTKLELRDRVQAVVLAYECGFVTPDLLGR